MYKKTFSLIKYFYHLIIIFGFLFEMPLPGTLTTRRVSCLFAILTLFFKRKELKLFFPKINKIRLTISFFIYFLLMIQIIILSIGIKQNTTSDYIEPWFIIYIILYIPVFALYSVIEFKSVKSFLYVYIGCFIIQTIAVFGAAINTPFRLLLYEIFYFGDDRFAKDIINGTRIMGINLHSSTGSIICSTCIILLTYCYLKNHIKSFVYFLLSTLFISMTVFIGRTGVLIELICICYAIIFGSKAHQIKNIFFITIFASILIFTISIILDNSDSASSDRLLNWMTASFRSENRNGTLDNINRVLPPISSEFIFGTTVMRGITSNGIAYDTDSGYIMIYGAVGLIGSFLYYTAFLNLYNIGRIKRNNKNIYWFFVLIIILSYLIEYKEPFMLKYIFSYMILVVTLFSLLENNKNSNAIKSKKNPN